MKFLIIKIDNYLTTNYYKMNTERVEFEFKNGELYILISNEPVGFKDFSHQLWNSLVLDRKVGGDSNDIAVEYGKVITELKQFAIPYGLQGIRIIKEITRICSEHLMFIYKMATKQAKIAKKNKTKGTPSSSGIFAVQVNTDTMEVVCLSCGTPPTPEKKLLKCSKCLLAHYCGATCQKDNWKIHKLNCCK